MKTNNIISYFLDSTIGVGTITATLKGIQYKYIIPSRFFYDKIIKKHQNNGNWLKELNCFEGVRRES